MNWKRDRRTDHWHAEHEDHKIRLQRSLWGNSTISAWEIYIDGKPRGKELRLPQAKGEAERELNILMRQTCP